MYICVRTYIFRTRECDAATQKRFIYAQLNQFHLNNYTLDRLVVISFYLTLCVFDFFSQTEYGAMDQLQLSPHRNRNAPRIFIASFALNEP